MKVKELIKKINDTKIYIEIKFTEKDGGGSFGVFQKNDLFYNDKLLNSTIKNINIQYFKGRRLLILEIV